VYGKMGDHKTKIRQAIQVDHIVHYVVYDPDPVNLSEYRASFVRAKVHPKEGVLAQA